LGPLLECVLLDHHPLLAVAALDFLLGLDQACHQLPPPSPATVWIARSIFGYVPQRQRLPAIACLISSSLGLALAASSADAVTICPGVQKPHCVASASTNASTSGCSRSPSIVVTSRSPTVWTSVMQESTGTPSSCTVQAPQCPSPQAILVPVKPRSSRSTSASVRPTGASSS